ncbi:hypothetical protein LWI28_007553 [Acer negundo]|uniref:Proline-rich protein 3-like n=1 Tax=Acer negundo TaxID=4023 RepID=A0AAD5IYN2_ACENE|nr:hypothetical protein LWI28_007553 [Acer negundo]
MALTSSMISPISVFVLLLSVALVFASATTGESMYGYDPNHIPEDKSAEPEAQEKLLSTTLGIQGIIYCRSGSKLTPLEGAVVRITCQVVDDDNECETVYSDETDADGYFFKTLSPLKQLTDGLKVIKECKAFLEDSPMEDCKVPTDVNGGISGALLNSYRILNNKSIKLFKVGPFFYTSETQYSDPNNGY